VNDGCSPPDWWFRIDRGGGEAGGYSSSVQTVSVTWGNDEMGEGSFRLGGDWRSEDRWVLGMGKGRPRKVLIRRRENDRYLMRVRRRGAEGDREGDRYTSSKKAYDGVPTFISFIHPDDEQCTRA
jgi:hypothetical protein